MAMILRRKMLLPGIGFIILIKHFKMSEDDL